ncbi:helix-turn-helix domain-containing protein [Rummeliibacillus sp. POC4]|uniref:helix-turn-helix domain-containing protein n=1 Tax=Rummeliibacillus sp. POC4 TaxID=2305899 RepID=UPI000E66D018|nr:helix-turn-helix domain-containing protein [Rummeliibacillus sp. POC4]RIJ64161.1 DNA-binding protein [Rummeliibacillus sp. POC4]
MDKITLNVKEVCGVLGLSKTTVYNMVRMNEIPYIKARGRILFNREVIESWTRGKYQEKVKN